MKTTKLLPKECKKEIRKKIEEFAKLDKHRTIHNLEIGSYLEGIVIRVLEWVLEEK